MPKEAFFPHPNAPLNGCNESAHFASRYDVPVLSGLRYYWVAAKGYRLNPWKRPYLQWRMETFYGKQAEDLGAKRFFRLLWRDRAQFRRFLRWANERQRAQRARQ